VRKPFILALFLVQFVCCQLAHARTLEEIRRAGTLSLCVAGSSADFYQANGIAFARYLGVAPKITVLPDWDQQFHNAAGVTVREDQYESQLLSNGDCDVFPNDLHINEWRRSKMKLVPYYATKKVIVAHHNLRASTKKEADLSGRHAAVQKGTAYETWLREQNASQFSAQPVSISLVPTADAMRMVSEGKADFTVIGAEAAFRWVRKDLDNLHLLFPVGDKTDVGWGIQKNAKDLELALTSFFEDSMRVASPLDISWQKHYDVSLMEYRIFEQSFDDVFNYRRFISWLLPLAIAVIVGVSAMYYSNRRLAKEIERHKETEAALRESQILISQESWRRSAIAEIALHLQQCETLESFGQALLSDLGKNIPVAQSLFCLWTAEKGSLTAVAHYAGQLPTPSESLESLSKYGGIVDRCIQNVERIRIDRPDSNCFKIKSGLGSFTPATLLVVPVCRLGRLMAIIEIATIDVFPPEQEQLLTDLEPIVAFSLENLLAHYVRSESPAEQGESSGMSSL